MYIAIRYISINGQLRSSRRDKRYLENVLFLIPETKTHKQCRDFPMSHFRADAFQFPIAREEQEIKSSSLSKINLKRGRTIKTKIFTINKTAYCGDKTEETAIENTPLMGCNEIPA